MSRHRVRAALALTIAALVAGAVAPATARADDPPLSVVVGDFEQVEGWHALTPPSGDPATNAVGLFERLEAADMPHGGDRAARLSANFSAGGAAVRLRHLDVDVTADSLSLWVRTSDVSLVQVRLYDASGEAYESRRSLTGDGTWRQLTVDVGAGNPTGGDKNGAFDGAVSTIEIQIPRSGVGSTLTGAIDVDDIVLHDATPPALWLHQHSVGNIVTRPEVVRLDVVSRADSIAWQLVDVDGRQARTGTRALVDGATTLGFSGLPLGYYELEVSAMLDGAVLESQTTTMAVLSPFTAPPADESPFGVVGHFSRTGWGDPGEGAALVAAVGATSVRDGTVWKYVETTPGVYDFSAYTALADAYEANGIDWLTMVQYENPLYDNGATPYTEAGWNGFAAYAGALHSELGDQIAATEVYNEYNLPNYGDRGDGDADSLPGNYIQLLERTYAAIKAEDPDAQVVAPSLAGLYRRTDVFPFLQTMFDAGAQDSLDKLGMHPYTWPLPPEVADGSYQQLNDLLAENDVTDKEVWVTEQGWPTHTAGNTEIEQASYIPRAVAVALANGVERYFVYSFMDEGINPDGQEANFGLIHNTLSPYGQWTPKPSYVSYAVAARMLTGTTFSETVDLADGLTDTVFARGSARPLHMLSATTPGTVAVSATGPITVTDMVGRAYTHTPSNGVVYLGVDGEPVYVTGPVTEVVATTALTLSTPGTAVAHEPVTAILHVDTTAAPGTGDVDTTAVIGSEDGVPVVVADGDELEVELTTTAWDVGRQRLITTLTDTAGRVFARLTSTLEVESPLSIRLRHVRDAGTDELVATVVNRSTQALPAQQLSTVLKQLNADGVAIDEHEVTTSVPALAIGESATLQVAIDGLVPAEYAYAAVIDVGEGSASRATGALVLLEPEAYIAANEYSVTVDGELDAAVADDPTFDLYDDGVVQQISGQGGRDDLGGPVAVTWDEDNLYVSAALTDDVHSQTGLGESVFAGDGLQFGVAAGVPGESPRSWYEYGVALTAQGPQAYRFRSADPTVNLTGPADDLEYAVVRDEEATTTTYEIAIPWTSLSPASSPDGHVSFSIIANEDDGNGREGWIEWGAGVGRAKASDKFRPLELVAGPQESVDRSALDAGIEQARAIGWVTVTAASYDALRSALDSAESVAPDADQATVDAAASGLVAAIEALVPVEDWLASQFYGAGDLVTHDGGQYLAQWWAQGEVPGATTTGSWMQVGAPQTCGSSVQRTWTPSWTYDHGDVVVHEGQLWEASWWTRGQEPGDVHGPWIGRGTC